MSRSSARFVAYDLRPNKQTERRIIMDMLRMARGAGLNVSTYPYIGMGGKRFYDFEMLHKYLGIRSMISIEQDNELVERCKFNKPYEFISIFEGRSSEFIDQHQFETPSVIWLDYDWTLSKLVTSDVLSLASKLQPGSFVFVTVKAELPQTLMNRTAPIKIEHYKEELGDLALDCKPHDVGRDGHPRYVERVLNATFQKAFSPLELKFLTLMRILYRDTTWMATVGGCLCDDAQAAVLTQEAQSEFPFLYMTADAPYQLPDLNFTAKERVLLDRFVTSHSARKSDTATMKNLGFSTEAIDAYRGVIRFLPKYVETFM